MKTVICNLRGTSGSGKSTVAFTLLKNYPNEELKGSDGKVKGYRVDASEAGVKAPIYIIGRYTTACGGLDTVPTQLDAAERCVKAWQSGGHVLAEGLLASAAGPKGALTAGIQETGAAVFAILDTPFELCVERVLGRRAARGDERPFNPKNTNDKYTQTHSTAKALRAAGGYDVRDIRHTHAFKDVLAIFQDAESV